MSSGCPPPPPPPHPVGGSTLDASYAVSSLGSGKSYHPGGCLEGERGAVYEGCPTVGNAPLCTCVGIGVSFSKAKKICYTS